MIRLAKPLPTGSHTPHVHVVVPCYRYGMFLEGCVESIIRQPGVRTTVHIIDDASPDGSFSVAERLASLHPNVKAEKNDVNIGHIATYNKGLSRAESDYLVLLSADDQLAPGALQRAVALMECHPEVGLVYGHPQTFDTEPRVSFSTRHSWSIWTGSNWIDRQFRRGLSIIYSPEAVVRTSLQHQVGYYLPDLPHSGDLEMWLRMAENASVGRINGPDQAYRRVHPASMMNSQFAGVVTDLYERRRAYEWFLRSETAPEAVRTRRAHIMNRRLAEEALGWAADARRGGQSNSNLDEAVEFALKIFPDASVLPMWMAASTDSKGGIWQAAMQTRQTMADKLRWRRWRHLGN
ncbi:glycosyltransferase family 2 protein [Paeniglutamicibacter sp. MACA_103]|uniref:glycosyltransferase family 2 protein n=1 Tax=Paeniglutamicibacter sp. MACA_103 TaxID=3377337 RepID=UPI00389463F9